MPSQDQHQVNRTSARVADDGALAKSRSGDANDDATLSGRTIAALGTSAPTRNGFLCPSIRYRPLLSHSRWFLPGDPSVLFGRPALAQVFTLGVGSRLRGSDLVRAYMEDLRAPVSGGCWSVTSSACRSASKAAQALASQARSASAMIASSLVVSPGRPLCARAARILAVK